MRCFSLEICNNFSELEIHFKVAIISTKCEFDHLECSRREKIHSFYNKPNVKNLKSSGNMNPDEKCGASRD